MHCSNVTSLLLFLLSLRALTNNTPNAAVRHPLQNCHKSSPKPIHSATSTEIKLAGKTKRGRAASTKKTGKKQDAHQKQADEPIIPTTDANQVTDAEDDAKSTPPNESRTINRPDPETDGSDDDAKSTPPDENRTINLPELETDESDDDGPLEEIRVSDLPSQTINLVRNDESALTKKLGDIALFHGSQALPFRESLQLTMPLSTKLPDSLAMDDLQRERRFAELATESVHLGLERLRREKVKFRRPSDYFAEMVKTDSQMAKVKARIIHEKEKIQAAEKRRNNREITNNRKKLRGRQLEQQQEKKRKAKEEIEAFSKLRKQRLKDRAKGNHSDDDEFPIDFLEVEQLDSDNRFQNHKDIASGKKKPWRPDATKGKDGRKGKPKRPGKEARKKKRGTESGGNKFGKPRDGQRGGKLKAAGGIKKKGRR